MFQGQTLVLGPPLERSWLAYKTVYHSTIYSKATFQSLQLLARFPLTLCEAGSEDGSEVASTPGGLSLSLQTLRRLFLHLITRVPVPGRTL